MTNPIHGPTAENFRTLHVRTTRFHSLTAAGPGILREFAADMVFGLSPVAFGERSNLEAKSLTSFKR